MENVNWKELENRARRMSFDALCGAIDDIRKTLPFADALDRETGTDNGGRYRDEASVYRREIAKRRENRLTDAAERGII